MSKVQFRGEFGLNDNVIHVGLSLIEFKENDVIIIYSPALDLSG